MEGIVIFNKPQKVDLATWADNHIDCDTLILPKDDPDHLYVVAYAASKEYNDDLREKYSGCKVLSGITSQEVWTVV